MRRRSACDAALLRSAGSSEMWLRSFITSHCNEFFDLFKLTFRNGGKTFKIPTSSAATLANAFDGAGLGFCSRSLRRVTASTPSEAGGRGNPGDQQGRLA